MGSNSSSGLVSRTVGSLTETSRRILGGASDPRAPHNDVIIFLDEENLDQRIPGWREMRSPVQIEFLGRAIRSALNQKHWAWLLKGETFYSLIEYGAEGIVIQYFPKERGITMVCGTIMGNDCEVRYDDRFSTTKTFNQIIQKVNTMKSDYSAQTYHAMKRNCRDFVRELGRYLDPSFHPADARTDTHLHTVSFGMIDPTFPKGRRVG
ncbi:unnamed protein product [Adineta ricciae]|uniref:PPPDE domain-containing protein n=1 Tax=Adineta ricciae TaxID=249248 RepID=A0A814P5A5_ADIRI|nr:unnamed protein product [Adineta ricciae]CAF1264441.1 unnamed protein product [Adineta ricciae]